jgi:hypothetical protein
VAANSAIPHLHPTPPSPPPKLSRRRTRHTRFTSRGLRGSQYTIPQPLWYTSTKCFGRITSIFPCTLLYTGLHRGQSYGTGGDITEQGRCPPKPHRERSVHKGPDTQSAPCAQTRCTLPPGSHRTAFCGQPRANEQEVGSSFYGPVGPGWVERIGKGYHLDITARGADTISGCRSLRLLAAGLVEVQHPKLMRLVDPRGCQGAGE